MIKVTCASLALSALIITGQSQAFAAGDSTHQPRGVGLDLFAIQRGKLELGWSANQNPADNNSLNKGETVLFHPFYGNVSYGAEDFACAILGLPRTGGLGGTEIWGDKACEVIERSAYFRFSDDESFQVLTGTTNKFPTQELLIPETADRLETYILFKIGKKTGCYVDYQNFSASPRAVCNGPVIEIQDVFVSNFGKNFAIPVE